jgi:hypothetical protein
MNTPMTIKAPDDLSAEARALLEDVQTRVILGPVAIVCHPEHPPRILEYEELQPIALKTRPAYAQSKAAL